jgi:toxin ParE1/3/4
MVTHWTKLASEDLVAICEYTERELGAAQARRTALAIYDTADSLDTTPTEAVVGHKPETRELVLNELHFLIIYRVRLEAVEILRILHGRQKWPP